MAAPAKASPPTSSRNESSAAATSASSSGRTGISRCRRRTGTSSWSGRAPASLPSAPSFRSAGRRGARAELAVLRRSEFHPRFSLSARLAGSAGRWLAHPDGRRLLARPPEKAYVQHKIWDRRRDLIEWLDGGANAYVCGDAKAMAKDVRAALVSRLRRREGAVAGSRRAGGGGPGARQALPAGHLLSLRRLEGQ